MDHRVDFENKYFQVWLVALPLSYGALALTFRALGLWRFPTRYGSRASDILTFLILAGLCVVYLSLAGVIGRFSLFGIDDYDKLFRDQWYGRSLFVENHLLYPMLAYQFWNIVLCLFSSDLRDPAMIGHHFATASLAYCMLRPYAQYQCFYFSGIVEISNIPLTLVDLFKYFPSFAKAAPGLNQLSRVC
jgi:hypothetical protein